MCIVATRHLNSKLQKSERKINEFKHSVFFNISNERPLKFKLRLQQKQEPIQRIPVSNFYQLTTSKQIKEEQEKTQHEQIFQKRTTIKPCKKTVIIRIKGLVSGYHIMFWKKIYTYHNEYILFRVKFCSYFRPPTSELSEGKNSKSLQRCFGPVHDENVI